MGKVAAVDPEGTRVGRLKLLRVIPGFRDPETRKWKGKKWECLCDCGKTMVVLRTNVVQGITKSCGCLNSETRSNRASHGESRGGMSRLYAAWNSMMQRCYNPKGNRRHRYHDRGIIVCERWHTPENFFRDMGPHPGKGFSLYRTDNDKNYSPDNCKWSTAVEQGYNTSTNVIVEGKNLLQLSIETGLPPTTIRDRLSKGWSVERALSQPKRKSPTKRGEINV